MWKDYLAFSKSERVAFWTLSISIMLSASLVFAVRSINWGANSNNQAYQDKLEAYFDSINVESEMTNKELEVLSLELNSCSADELKNVGLSTHQVKNILAYRSKGGMFKSVSDLRKIYSIDSTAFEKVSSHFYIAKADQTKKNTSIAFKIKEKPNFTIELNSCDTISLSLLPGIGASLSKRIVKYRSKIGGYYNTEQLLEVYGFSPELIQRILPNIHIDTTLIEPQNLNQLSVFQMKSHPYLDFYKTKEIIEYRNKEGLFSDMNQILELKSFENCDKAMFRRYFTVNPIP